MADIAGLVLPFFGMIFIGVLVARLTHQPLEALGWMNTFVLYVALPALFFQLLAKTPVERLAEWRFLLAVLLATFLIFLAMFALSVISSRGNVAESVIKGLAAAYGNIGYMGPGLALLAFGEDAAVPVALIVSFENVMHFVVAATLMTFAKGDQRSLISLAFGMVRNIVQHPFVLATAAGVLAAYMEFQAPVPVDRLLSYLAAAAAPCALFALGVTLALRPLKRVPRSMGTIALFKLVLHPLLCYVILSWFGAFDPIWVYSAVLLASLPVAANVFVIAQQYGVWTERASASVLLTTILSVVTVTAIVYAITNGMLPADLFP